MESNRLSPVTDIIDRGREERKPWPQEDNLESSERAERLVYSVSELAEVLGLSRSNTYDLLQQKILPSVRIRGRLLVPKQAIAKLLQREGAAM